MQKNPQKYFRSRRRKENDDIAFFSSQSLLFGGKWKREKNIFKYERFRWNEAKQNDYNLQTSLEVPFTTTQGFLLFYETV